MARQYIGQDKSVHLVPQKNLPHVFLRASIGVGVTELDGVDSGDVASDRRSPSFRTFCRAKRG